MSGKNTKIIIIDNSGVLFGKCLSISKFAKFQPGSLITFVIKKTKVKKVLKLSNVCKVLIVRCAYIIKRTNSLIVYDTKNAGIVLKKNEFFPLGTRLFGPICSELRRLRLIKLLSLAPYSI